MTLESPLNKLIDHDDEDHNAKTRMFTDAEASSIREVLNIHAMFKSWGKLGRGLLWLLMAFGGAVVAWEAIITRLGK